MDCPSCKATLQTEECADCGANASWIWLGRTRSWLFAACAVLTAGLVYDWLSENARSAPAALPGLAALVVARAVAPLASGSVGGAGHRGRCGLRRLPSKARGARASGSTLPVRGSRPGRFAHELRPQRRRQARRSSEVTQLVRLLPISPPVLQFVATLKARLEVIPLGQQPRKPLRSPTSRNPISPSQIRSIQERRRDVPLSFASSFK